MTQFKHPLSASVGLSLLFTFTGLAAEEPPTATAIISAPPSVTRIGVKPTEFAITCFALAPGGDILALGSNDGTIRLWSLAASKVIGSIETKEKAYTGSVAFSPDGKTLAFHVDDEPVRLWDLTAGKESGRLPETLLWVEHLCFAASGRQLGIVSDAEAFVWNLDSGKVWKSPQPVSSLAFSTDGTMLALGFNTLRLVDPATGSTLREIGKMDGRVTSLQFSPTGNHLLVVDAACPGTSVRILDSDEGEEMILGDKIRSDSAAARFSPDGKIIAVSGERSEAVFWDAASGRKLDVLPGIDRSANTLIFTPDGKRLVARRSESIADVLILGVPDALHPKRSLPRQ